jgi:LuxR family maltose regulon positive regulatory protein
MAEPAATASSVAAGHERDALLATKLQLPRPRPGLVACPRLLQRLTEGMGRELVLVCTPAGFGKTTLLADWARRDPRPVGWLSLDEADNDPARFWRHVAAALDPVRPGVAERVTALLGSPPASFEGPVTALVNELAGLPEEVVLVLDDYHLIQAPAVHASVEFLLEHLPPSLRLVLASRADPPLPLARLRGRGQLAELREADLRFTPQEAGGGRAGLPLRPLQPRRLARDRAADPGRVGLRPPRPRPARPRAPGRGAGDLPAGAGGGGRGAGPTGHAGRRHRLCGPGRGGL